MTQFEDLEHRRAGTRGGHLAGDDDLIVEPEMAPVFTTQPRSLTNLREGQRVHFEAKLEPLTDPHLQVEWFKNGKPIIVGHRFRPIHDFGYVALVILDIINEDSGTYTARATNRIGSCECQAQLSCQSKSLQNQSCMKLYFYKFVFLWPVTKLGIKFRGSKLD